MTSPISQQGSGAAQAALMCYPIHDAGISPNTMNRFLQPSMQKVLFVI